MTQPIKVGDLVQIVRGHECFLRERGGHVFVVAGISSQSGGGWYCQRCGTRDLEVNEKFGAVTDIKELGKKGIPLRWLRRIPPLEELNDVKRDEEITA